MRAPELYREQAETCKKKSRILAERMKKHAYECTRCNPNDDNFYGLDYLEV
jgi:hypothetical protein